MGIDVYIQRAIFDRFDGPAHLHQFRTGSEARSPLLRRPHCYTAAPSSSKQNSSTLGDDEHLQDNMRKGSWTTARATAATYPTTSTATRNHVVAERGVSCFEGTLEDCKDLRRRAKLCVARKILEDKAKETLILLMTGLSRLAWGCVEAIGENTLDNESHLPKFFNIMHAWFKYDHRVELPNKFEEAFMKYWSQRDTTLISYVIEFERKFKQRVQGDAARQPGGRVAMVYQTSTAR